jgi:uncharacterized protein YndB with AHSA1/START domain
MNKTIIRKDLTNKKIFVTREFAGTLEQVWQAWTDSKILDQWWAPRPWKAKTKFMDFREGGYWLYAMEGPEGERHWARADYKKIVKQKSYEAVDCFCDENGVKNSSFPSMSWRNVFIPSFTGTNVEVEITFPSQADLEKIVEMGFEAGFTAAHGNLDELLAKK